MSHTYFSKRKATIGLTLAVGIFVAGCGGGADPILGADVNKVPVVAPVGVPGAPGGQAAASCPAVGVSVTMTNPSNNNLSASTSTSGVPNGGKQITATFSGPVDPATISPATFIVTQAGGAALTPSSVTYDSPSNTAILTTSAALPTSTTFNANIKSPVVNGVLTAGSCSYSWSFKTTSFVAAAPSPVNFGAANTFAIAATAGVTNTGVSLVNGDAVLNPTDTCNAVPVGNTGTFGLCGGAAPGIKGIVVTPTYPNTTRAQQVTDALRAAYLSITPPAGPPAAGSLGGGKMLATTTLGAPTGAPQVAGQNYFAPGVYTSGSTITISGDIVLDGQGDANAVFVFQAGSAITATPGAPSPAAHARILLVNGAKASNVFWQAGSSATLGNYAEWNGSILAGASVTMQTSATSCGRLFAGAFTAGAFVFDTNVVSIPGTANAPAGCL